MKQTHKKLKLDLSTIRNLQLRVVAGAKAAYTAVPCFLTDSEIAGGCTVTDATCQCGGTSTVIW